MDMLLMSVVGVDVRIHGTGILDSSQFSYNQNAEHNQNLWFSSVQYQN